MGQVIRGKIRCGHHQGWMGRYATTDDEVYFKGKINPEVSMDTTLLIPERINAETKKYIIVDPTGSEYFATKGMPAFCTEHNINLAGLRKFIQGRSTMPSYLGWTGRYATTEDIQRFEGKEAQ